MEYKKTQLKSGLTVIIAPMKGTKTVTVLVGVQAGSNFENKQVNGISHFLEHMMFKGTPKRPSTKAISEELDGIGGEYNAFTSKEWTGYYAKTDVRHTDTILDILSDMYQNAMLKSRELERERMVILEEMNMYQDMPQRHVDDLIEELLYGDQPQGWKIIGDKKSVGNVNGSNMRKYFKEKYIAKNTTVVIAGNTKNISTKKVGEYFGKLSSRGRATKKPQVLQEQTVPALALHHKKTDQTHLAFALRAYKAGDKNLPALKILNIILGGNMSSRLFLNIREKEGLCYYINSGLETYSTCGYLSVKAGVDNKRAKKALRLIIKELVQLKEEGITDAELKKTKDYFSGKLALALETSDEVAFTIGGQTMLDGNIKTPEELLAEVEKVTEKDVNNVAREIVQPDRLNLAMISPYKDKKDFINIVTV